MIGIVRLIRAEFDAVDRATPQAIKAEAGTRPKTLMATNPARLRFEKRDLSAAVSPVAFAYARGVATFPYDKGSEDDSRNEKNPGPHGYRANVAADQLIGGKLGSPHRVYEYQEAQVDEGASG